MATVGCDQQTVADAEITLELFIRELKSGAAAQHQHPFEFRLVVPEAFGAAGEVGVNALQAPLRS